MAKKEKRFIITQSEGSEFTICSQVLVDSKTGVNYLWVKSGYAGGLTPLIDREGKPIITSVADIEE